MTEPTYSEYQINKAKKIIRMNGVAEIDINAYQIRSGTHPDECYFIEDGVCNCPATKFGKQCTHLLVVEMFKTHKIITEKY